jgi:hypothetical protein
VVHYRGRGFGRRDPLLDGFEIYADAVAELFGQRSKVIDSLIKKTTKKKGRYSK